MPKNSYMVAAAIAVLMAFVVGMLVYYAKPVEEPTNAANSNAASLVQFHSPSTGALDAKVTIVEFFDPACEACRMFHPIAESILADNKGKVRLVLRYAAFQSQPVWASHHNPQVQPIWEFLQPIGPDIERIRRDMESPGIAAIVC